MPYLGVAPNPRENREVDDISGSFNGSTTAFTLQAGGSNVSPGKDTAIIVSLGGVIQNPGTDYTIAASTITFTTAPASGLSFFGVVLAQSIDIETVADNTVTTAKIVDGAVTNAKVNNSAAIAGTKISPDFGSQAISTTNDSVTIGDSIIHSGDTNTKIRFPAADTVTVETAGSERMRIDSSGNVGIGTSSPTSNLFVNGTSLSHIFTARTSDSNGNCIINILSEGTTGNSRILFSDTAANDGIISYSHNDRALVFGTAGTSEDMRIDSSGRVGIGTTSPNAMLHLRSDGVSIIRLSDSDTSGENDSTIGRIDFETEDSNNPGVAANIHSRLTDTTNGACSLSFATGTPTTLNTRMLINSSGRISINTTSDSFDGVTGNLNIANTNTNNHTVINCSRNTVNDRSQIRFSNPNGNVGSINTSGSATSFNTSSDYRLKENATAISDGITRLKTLKPYRFNFKVDASTTVDGFFAHEVTAVPEAITGTKDEVDSDNKPVYQGIDQSKLVPLLVAAVQELIGKVEALEAKVAALEAA